MQLFAVRASRAFAYISSEVAFTLLSSGEGALSDYRFGDKSIAHLFCKTCGIQAFGFGKGMTARRWQRSMCGVSTTSI